MNLNFSVKNKLLLGFGVVILILVVLSLNLFFALKDMKLIEERLIELRQLTVLTGTNLENGINQSLAGLRGFMILGKDPKKGEAMKNTRRAGWKKIDQAMQQLQGFSQNWTNPENINRLNQLEKHVNAFRKAQQDVEGISHSIDEIPAFKTLLTEAAPRAKKILSSITGLIDEEEKLDATPERKKLLKLLADSRGSFAVGLANIRAYLLSGDTKFQEIYSAKWQVNQTRLKQISAMSGLMNASQLALWNNYQNIRNEFAQYPPIMFKQRSGDDWNMAN